MTIHYHDAGLPAAAVENVPVPSGSSGSSTLGRAKQPYRCGLKRLLDTVLICLFLPFVLPVLSVIVLFVACDGGSPLYRQVRIGRHGRPYYIWKVRSMVADAETALAVHLATHPAARAEWACTQKLKHDPRVTRVGRFLRRSSLDELPQLWNVLKGDMSLVGPRPMLPSQQDMYPGKAYYTLRPGITGYWQISERNKSSFSARASFDTAYERDLSLGTDMSVLLRTVLVVLRGTGC